MLKQKPTHLRKEMHLKSGLKILEELNLLQFGTIGPISWALWRPQGGSFHQVSLYTGDSAQCLGPTYTSLNLAITYSELQQITATNTDKFLAQHRPPRTNHIPSSNQILKGIFRNSIPSLECNQTFNNSFPVGLEIK